MRYIVIYGGALTVICYLSAPNLYLTFEQFVEGLANMKGSVTPAFAKPKQPLNPAL